MENFAQISRLRGVVGVGEYDVGYIPPPFLALRRTGGGLPAGSYSIASWVKRWQIGIPKSEMNYFQLAYFSRDLARKRRNNYSKDINLSDDPLSVPDDGDLVQMPERVVEDTSKDFNSEVEFYILLKSVVRISKKLDSDMILT